MGMEMEIIIVAIILINSAICGVISRVINQNKGYEGGFSWGFWLGELGILVVVCKTDKRILEDLHAIREKIAPAQWENAQGKEENDTSSSENFNQERKIVNFGSFLQTKNGTDVTPIEWIVLDVQGSRSLLVSRYGLDSRPYNKELKDTTWEKCTLRRWLNNEFLNKAFTEEQQRAILTTAVDNSKAQGYSEWSTNGGNDTQDKVFLLSYAEANKYFGVTYDDSNNSKARIAPTAYAIAQGANTNNSHKNADGAAAAGWWLRSPGHAQKLVAYVYTDGSLGGSRVNDEDNVVRPAFWLNLEAVSIEL